MDRFIAGIKDEEYREIKPYFITRLCRWRDGSRINKIDEACFALDTSLLVSAISSGKLVFTAYTHIRLSYGYTRKTMMFELDNIRIGRGRPAWGTPGKWVFILMLGRRVQ